MCYKTLNSLVTNVTQHDKFTMQSREQHQVSYSTHACKGMLFVT